MKVLSLEQKAEAYDKAFEIVKELLSRCTDNRDRRTKVYRVEDIESIFPELKKSEDEKIKEDLIQWISDFPDMIWSGHYREDVIAWLEKQGEQEQLYIRFGEIPTDEKSKIFQGEIEVGTENGVSVYPAFKTSEGDIVLGLSLPITKTTLYTQQHLIEYDDRPCYLVTGDYIGKDTDGQPLINNVSIIEKIDTYRVKEKMQSEQKVRYTALIETGNGGIKTLVTRELPINSRDDEQKPADEPKFKPGNWIVSNLKKDVFLIKSTNRGYFTLEDTKGNIYSPCLPPTEDDYHLWTIQDAKDGDVLATDKSVFIYAKVLYNKSYAYCGVDKYGVFKNNCSENNWTNSVDNIHPATKEQRDSLMKAMADAGYTFDFEKKKLKKIETEIEIPFGAKDSELQEATYFIPKGFYAKIDNDKVVIKQGEKLTAWSEEDEHRVKDTIYFLDTAKKHYASAVELDACIDWLKSLKQRIGG